MLMVRSVRVANNCRHRVWRPSDGGISTPPDSHTAPANRSARLCSICARNSSRHGLPICTPVRDARRPSLPPQRAKYNWDGSNLVARKFVAVVAIDLQLAHGSDTVSLSRRRFLAGRLCPLIRSNATLERSSGALVGGHNKGRQPTASRAAQSKS